MRCPPLPQTPDPVRLLGRLLLPLLPGPQEDQVAEPVGQQHRCPVLLSSTTGSRQHVLPVSLRRRRASRLAPHQAFTRTHSHITLTHTPKPAASRTSLASRTQTVCLSLMPFVPLRCAVLDVPSSGPAFLHANQCYACVQWAHSPTNQQQTLLCTPPACCRPISFAFFTRRRGSRVRPPAPGTRLPSVPLGASRPQVSTFPHV